MGPKEAEEGPKGGPKEGPKEGLGAQTYEGPRRVLSGAKIDSTACRFSKWKQEVRFWEGHVKGRQTAQRRNEDIFRKALIHND